MIGVGRRARRSAPRLLAKADLLTDMVGEFPELQGTMGTYYARHDGEPEEVALACSEHYQPRFSGDDTAVDRRPARAVALADKLETLVGIWGIGLQPTGEKDPFALRRHALGVLRILLEKRLRDRSARPAAHRAQAIRRHAERRRFDAKRSTRSCIDRLRGVLRERGFTPSEIDAVLA